MYEKLIKCAPKTGFEIQSYSLFYLHMKWKTEYCQKIKGACSSFFQNISTARILHDVNCPKKIPFLPHFGGGATAPLTPRLLRLCFIQSSLMWRCRLEAVIVYDNAARHNITMCWKTHYWHVLSITRKLVYDSRLFYNPNLLLYLLVLLLDLLLVLEMCL